MPIKLLFSFLMLVCPNCKEQPSPIPKKQAQLNNTTTIYRFENPYAKIEDIPLPQGFSRIAADSGSFAEWLGKVALKKEKTVFLYSGSPKSNQTAQFAVLDIAVGHKDLQQCADAVMRLRGEFLFEQHKFGEIIFTDNAGSTYHFNAPYSRANFDKYLESVFGMCGSASLSKQLNTISLDEIQAGDVFIRGGFPGHAEMVMACAGNKEEKKIYLLAQSYMPAQDIHVLINPKDEKLSPWYAVTTDDLIETPEYNFNKTELKRW